MSGVASGIGLASGLNISDIVGKLMTIEKLPADRLQKSIDNNNTLKSSLQKLSLQFTSANISAANLGAGRSFTNRTATASSDALVVSAGRGAALGSFSVTPRQLAATSQLISSGLTDSSALVGAGTIKFSQGGFIDRDTKLSQLNGGNGVRAGSIRIVDQSGAAANVDLTGAVTARQVVDAINSTSGIGVRASIAGNKLSLKDISGGAGTLAVTDIGSGQTAADLGLSSLTKTGADYAGTVISKLGNNLDLRTLNDGNGVRNVQGLVDFQLSAGGVSFGVDIDSAKTVGDVVNLINSNAGNTGNRIVASIAPNSNKLTLTDSQGATVTASVLNNSGAAQDLGLLTGTTTGNSQTSAGSALVGKDILSGIGTVLLKSLNGGQGLTAGTISVNGTSVDLSSAVTVDDIIKGINSAGIAGVTASVSGVRNSLNISSTSGPLSISDVSGTLASNLGIAVNSSANKLSVTGSDLNAQYISENTSLASLNGGTGIPKGKFRITDGTGASATVDLTGDTDKTVGDVIRKINTRGIGVSARINDTGDGILLSRTSGTSSITVSEVDGGTTAAALRLKSADGGAAIDGSFETKITLSATDKLSDLLSKLQASNAPVQAAIINDGSSLNPARLSISSKQPGSVGELLIDGGSTNLSFATTTRARDAVALFGSTDQGGTPIQLVSNSNAFSNIIPGVTINAVKTSTTPVTVTVGSDDKSISSAVDSFVKSLNDITSYIKDNSKYDQKTNERGIFFTDSTVRFASQRITSFLGGAFKDAGSSVKSLGQLGVSVDSDGKYQFDSSAFAAAYAANPSDVEKFFTTATNGFVAKFQGLTTELTDVTKGLLTGRENAVNSAITTQQKSLDSLNIRLSAKQQLLFNKFYAQEAALSKLQGQQSALTQLTSAAATK